MDIFLQRLDSLRSAGALTDLDVHFARFLARLAGSASPELALAAALASHATGEGHVCVDLNALTGGWAASGAELSMPALADWIAALQASPVVGAPGEWKPLVLDSANRLYLHRYWRYQQNLAAALLARARALEPVDETRLADGLAQLFPASGDGVIDWQKVAAATALLRRFCAISGGPGTGKTSTVVRILALLQSQAGELPLRIGLAAPTGKAAARLQEAVRGAKTQLKLPAELSAVIPEEATTLHRLLGARPNSVYFRHHREHPLALDVLVVDEASMVALALMAKLIDALPPTARLILLGDRDQLASVEAGAVLGEICNQAGFSEPFAQRLARLTATPLSALQATPAQEAEAAREPARPASLSDCIVVLQKSYRFGAHSGVGKLAAAVNSGDADGALRLLEGGAYPDLAWWLAAEPAFAERLEQAALANYREFLHAVAEHHATEQVFAAFNHFRLLCAHRAGVRGVENVNGRIERAMLQQRGLSDRHVWYPGRPVMVTQNDYAVRLFNGDVGIALPADDGELRVFFQQHDGMARAISPARLPPHETVYAMTVHKAQGSEFDRVLLVLPERMSAALGRELLYTGITRARLAVELWGGREVIKQAVAHRQLRSSGLRDALWGAEPTA